jgi:hypothetical protein
MLEANTYQRFKVTINNTRVAAQVRIRVIVNSDGGIGYHQGSEMLLGVGRADGGAFATLQYAFSGANVAISEPQLSGNDVIFGLTVSNNGTGTSPTVEIVCDYMSSSPTSLVWSGVTGTTAGGTSLLGISKLAPNGVANAVVVTSNGIGLGNTTPSSGTGIIFPATQSASSDANTLDDYEEGSWTPSPFFSTVNTYTGGTALGSYTKVGRLVSATFLLAFEKNTATGNFTITGLPFTSLNSTGIRGALAVSYLQRIGQADKIVTGYVTENTTTIQLYLTGQTSASTVLNITNSDIDANTTNVVGTVTYPAA